MKRLQLIRAVSILALTYLLVVCTEARADRLNDALDTPVSLQFENTTLHEIFLFLMDKYEINVHMDHSVVAPAGSNVSQPFVTDGRVQDLSLRDVPAREALTTILKPLGLAFTAKRNYVWVTTPERMTLKPYADLETQIFQVPAGQASESSATSAGEPEFVVLLRKVIPVVLEPDTGERLSYMRYNLLTKQLVVLNTRENLDTIQQLFNLIDNTPKQHQQ